MQSKAAPALCVRDLAGRLADMPSKAPILALAGFQTGRAGAFPCIALSGRRTAVPRLPCQAARAVYGGLRKSLRTIRSLLAIARKGTTVLANGKVFRKMKAENGFRVKRRVV